MRPFFMLARKSVTNVTRIKRMNPSRFSKVGFTDQKNTKTDSYINHMNIPISAVLSAAAQSTGQFLPFRAQVTNATINVLTQELTGATKTVNVGVAGGAEDAIIAAAAVAGVGFKGTGTVFNGGGQEITFTLGSADFVELEAEIIIEYIGSDE